MFSAVLFCRWVFSKEFSSWYKRNLLAKGFQMLVYWLGILWLTCVKGEKTSAGGIAASCGPSHSVWILIFAFLLFQVHVDQHISVHVAYLRLLLWEVDASASKKKRRKRGTSTQLPVSSQVVRNYADLVGSNWPSQKSLVFLVPMIEHLTQQNRDVMQPRVA